MTIETVIKDALHRIETALSKLTWVHKPLDEARAWSYQGSGEGINVCVVEFNLEPQGFPKGSKGYDGAATIVEHHGSPVIVHLTRELAEKAYRIAAQQEK